MIHLLGDFYIDEAPDISLNVKEITTLAYLILKNGPCFFNEMSEVLSEISEYDSNYVKNILKRLSKKVGALIKIEADGYKIIVKTRLNTDVEVVQVLADSLIDEGEPDRIVEIMNKLADNYTNDFLPFVSNLWVRSYRDILKISILDIMASKLQYLQSLQYDRELRLGKLKLRLINLLARLYVSNPIKEIIYEIKNSFPDAQIGFGYGPMNKFASPEILTLSHNDLNSFKKSTIEEIIHNSEEANVLSSQECLIIVKRDILERILRSG